MKRREALKVSAALLGYGLASPVFSGMLTGCQVEAGEDWTPIFFSPEQARTIAEVAEHILPRTDTPGAKDVFVHRFMDKLIAECYEEEKQQSFLRGLQSFQSFCQTEVGNSFEDCDVSEKDIILKAQEETSDQPTGEELGGGPSFYRQIKGLTLLGYFSSEEVGKNVLNYDPIPGKFVGCVPLEEIGNAWTL